MAATRKQGPLVWVPRSGYGSMAPSIPSPGLRVELPRHISDDTITIDLHIDPLAVSQSIEELFRDGTVLRLERAKFNVEPPTEQNQRKRTKHGKSPFQSLPCPIRASSCYPLGGICVHALPSKSAK